MKVAVPVKANKKAIDKNFGHAPFFAILDSDTRKVTFAENPAEHANHDADTLAARAVIEMGIECLGLVKCSPKILNMLWDADLEVCETEGASVNENLESLMAGTLMEFDED